MKKLLLFSFLFLTFAGVSFGQTTLVDFETVQDPFVEPFDLTMYENAVANPDGSGSVGKVIKDGSKFWGGINVYFGGDITFTGTDDKFTIDFYTSDAGVNDSILFKFQLFPRDGIGGAQTIEVDAYYTDANDTQVGTWKTLEFALPDGTTGSYNQIVIFFGWSWAHDGDVYYFDNVVAPGFSAYGNTDVTFTITDKFNNAPGVSLFIDGAAATLAQEGNVYTHTANLAPYSVLVGQSVGIYEIVYTHIDNSVEVRDTAGAGQNNTYPGAAGLVCGTLSGTQDITKLILVEDPEDGTALAIDVGETPPTIDGTIDAVWSNAKTHTNQERGWFGAPSGLYSTWKVMWDIDNIYLLYTVEDATLNNGNIVDVWKNDCVETFFDMNQSASEGYDSDDWQIRTIPGLETWTGSANVTAEWSGNVQRGQSADDARYIVELAIPWISLSATFLPIVGTKFNYDCIVADVAAEGGARVYRESWSTAEDVAHVNTAYFGTITLSDLTNEGGGTGIRNTEAFNVTLFPNPASDQVSIRSDVAISSIRIMDMTGRVVNSVSSVNEYTTTMNVENLIGGVYLISITDMEGGSSVQRLRVL